MLELRPSCECCDKDLPPNSADAMICSFECTFCRACAETVLEGRCPNCGGELVRRPIRPADKLGKFPASTKRIVKPEGCAKAARAEPEATADRRHSAILMLRDAYLRSLLSMRIGATLTLRPAI